MGSRERQAHRSQQKQQAFGRQEQSVAQQVTLQAPFGVNAKDGNRINNDPAVAAVIENAVARENGLEIWSRPFLNAQTGTDASAWGAHAYSTLMVYDASGDGGSAEFFLAQGNKIWDVGGVYATPALTTATVYTSITGIGGIAPMYTQFNKTLIMVNSTKAIHYTRGSGWTAWSATCSGFSANAMYGITHFKSRLFAWEKDNSRFWYGSTDQIQGTLNPFDLGGVTPGAIQSVVNITRDGGAGPDDYLAFIMKNGKVAVYSGDDPGDANNWSLVGVYQIGKPLGRDSHVQYGQQTVVLCEDDFYFLPEDLMGKRGATPGATYRKVSGENDDSFQAVHWTQENLLVFSDGSVLNPEANMAYTNIYLSSADPHSLRIGLRVSGSAIAGVTRGGLAVFRDALYVAPERYDPITSGPRAVYRLNAPYETQKTAKVVTSNVKPGGKTSISLVRPVLETRPEAPSTASTPEGSLKYSVGLLWDDYASYSASVSAGAILTVETSSNTLYDWEVGIGYGDAFKVWLKVSASVSGEAFFFGHEVHMEQTGGL